MNRIVPSFCPYRISCDVCLGCFELRKTNKLLKMRLREKLLSQRELKSAEGPVWARGNCGNSGGSADGGREASPSPQAIIDNLINLDPSTDRTEKRAVFFFESLLIMEMRRCPPFEITVMIRLRLRCRPATQVKKPGKPLE